VARYYEPQRADILFAVGLGHYRADDWEDALLRTQEFAAAAPQEAWQCWPLLALIQQKLGHAAEARGWLAKAAEYRRQEQQRAEGWAGFAPKENWPDFEILYAEAEGLIKGGKP
jgi:tetratricopeptide (TPR) repeat protein